MTLVTGKPSSIRQDVHASELLTMINSITDGVMAIRLDRKVTFFNRAAIEITGFSEQEALGTPCYEIFGLKPEDCVLVRTLESQKPILNHYADITIANGRRIQISVSTSVLRDEDGKISGAIETFRDMSLVEALRKELQSSYSFEDIIGHSKPMREIFKLLPIISNSDSSVLIEGESGTGKELVARSLHEVSKRSSSSFIKVNCASIPESLIESELFGHEKGSFTGAVARRIGKFEEANGGTLLLDEISEMDPHLQAKLLRAVQEREIDRIGGTRPVKVDVRIVATSNRNMADEIAENRFREDLYFRLNVVNLALPSLSERPLDILHLSSHFIAKYAKENCVDALPLSDSATQALQDYPWPGNVRELENAMHRAVLLSSGKEISTDAIQLTAAASSSDKAAPTAIGGDMVGQTVAQVERGLIIDTLQHCLGNRTHAANILGISIRTLRNKLKLYNEQGFAVPMPGETERPSV